MDSFLEWLKGVFSPKKTPPSTVPSQSKPPSASQQPPKARDGTENPAKGTVNWYVDAWMRMDFDPGFEAGIITAARRVLQGRERYMRVASVVGCPWYFVGALHNMEASCNFEGVLHNGEKIIGTGRKTKLVPKGRGPFESWEDAAIDALHAFKGMEDWDIGIMLKRAEMYNGLGYLKNHPEENTPYLWAQTTINDGRGKYVADRKYDTNANSNGQVGFAAILKQLERMAEISVTIRIA